MHQDVSRLSGFIHVSRDRGRLSLSGIPSLSPGRSRLASRQVGRLIPVPQMAQIHMSARDTVRKWEFGQAGTRGLIHTAMRVQVTEQDGQHDAM